MLWDKLIDLPAASASPPAVFRSPPWFQGHTLWYIVTVRIIFGQYLVKFWEEKKPGSPRLSFVEVRMVSLPWSPRPQSSKLSPLKTIRHKERWGDETPSNDGLDDMIINVICWLVDLDGENITSASSCATSFANLFDLSSSSSQPCSKIKWDPMLFKIQFRDCWLEKHFSPLYLWVSCLTWAASSILRRHQVTLE